MKHYVISIVQDDLLNQRIYKLNSENKPSKDELNKLGIDFNSKRKDKIIIDEVSEQLQEYIEGIWLNKK